MKRYGFFFCILSTAFVLVQTASADAECGKKLVVFGDSLSDTGNSFISAGGMIPPSPPYAGGRFTGPSAELVPPPPPALVWVEYLADMLGIPRPVARLGGPPIEAATNYAFGGAVTGDTPVIVNPELIPDLQILGGLPLDDQVNLFLRDFYAAAAVNNGPCELDPANWHFLVWIGANDLVLRGDRRFNRSVNNIVAKLETLIQAGATQIIVGNAPDLTDLPGVKEDPSFWTDVKLDALSLRRIKRWVRKFNAKLNEELDELEDSHPAVSIDRLDVYSLLKTVIADPAAYGLAANTDVPVINEASLFLNGEPVIQNAPNALFWDGVHPTTFAHAMIAQAACQALGSACTPDW